MLETQSILPTSTSNPNALLLGLLSDMADGLIAPSTDILFPEYTDRPIEFMHEVLGVTYLTNEQKQIIQSLQDNVETNVQAAHGVGKTLLAGLYVLYHVLALGGLAVTTAPTSRQVKQLLWSEIRKALAKIAGKCSRQIDQGILYFTVSEDARAYGFASFDYSSDSFQGIHNAKLLIVLDEANGISPEIYEGAIACLTGTSNRMLAIGNPTAAGTSFEKSCKQSHLRVSVWDHPNVSWAYMLCGDGIHRLKPEIRARILDSKGNVKAKELPPELIPGAVSIVWIERIRKKYGEGSAYWTGRVEAEFPGDNAASIVPRSWFLGARARYDRDPERWDSIAATYLSNFGLDIGDGGDPHALARWQGPVLYSVKEKPTLGDRLDTIRAADWAKEEMNEHPRSSINVDRVGVGAGTLGILINEGWEAYGVNWGINITKKENSSDDTEPVLLNVKALQFWALREAFRKGEVAIAPLGEEAEELLMEELAGIYYETMGNDTIRIEDKAKTKRRIGRSPNAADATCMGYARSEADYLEGIVEGTKKHELPIDPELEELIANQDVISPALIPARHLSGLTGNDNVGLSFAPGAGFLSF